MERWLTDNHAPTAKATPLVKGKANGMLAGWIATPPRALLQPSSPWQHNQALASPQRQVSPNNT